MELELSASLFQWWSMIPFSFLVSLKSHRWLHKRWCIFGVVEDYEKGSVDQTFLSDITKASGEEPT